MNFYALPPNLDEEINEYERLVDQYLAGQIPAVKMKAFRVPFGVYEQRESETYMCRVRLPGGSITPDQLIGVAEIAEKYSDRLLHFTTRQEVQIHHVSLKDTVAIIKELKKLGLSTRGGGGNTVRNIVGDGSHLVEPYVRALTTRLIAEKDSWNLPRKLKIAFSGDSSDQGLATANDLGFIFKDNHGEPGFSVYIAGGMGAKPRVASLLYEFVPADQVYNIAKATKQIFDKFGNRKNKHAARLRFLYEKLGAVEFVKRFEHELAEVKKQNYPVLSIEPFPADMVKGTELQLFLGDLSIAEAKALGHKLQPFGNEVLRALSNQNLNIRNVPAKALPKQVISRFLGQAVACAGASTCRLWICLSRDLLTAIKKEFEESGLDLARLDDLKLKISGCPNACGHHHLADIGFYGVAKRSNDRLVPCYQVVTGGLVGEGKTKIAERIGVLPAKAIPKFLLEVVKSGKKPDDLIEKYSQVENEDYYSDWGANKAFSVADKVEGECSAGIYDLIDWDFENIKTSLAKHDARGVVVAACRALLVTKGLEPKSEQDAVILFKENFIGRHLPAGLGGIIDRYLQGGTVSEGEAKQLAGQVRLLYDKMDSSLRFPDLVDIDGKENWPRQEHGLFRDFRGVACPLNFVKTKLVLETMKPGELLEVLLDDGEPIENVPASVRAEGYKIEALDKVDNYWKVLIRK